MVFSGVGGNANAASVHKFLGAAGSVVFQAGGSLTTQGATLDPTDTPFGTTTGLAVFQSGAGFIQQAGDDPYGPAAFQAGSTYTFSGGTAPGGSNLAGRTYGNLVFATSAALPTYTGTTRLNILNNLQLTAANTATLTLNLTGTSATTGIAVGGNIIVDGGTLQLNPGSDVNLTLNGATIQHIQGDGTFSISPTTVRLAIDNPGGVTLQKPLTFEGLVLTNGLLNTSVSSPLTIAIANQANSASFISGGSATSFVNGPLNITTSATGAKTFTFPIGALRNGTTNVYRPVTLTATQSSTAGSYTAVQTEGRAANLAPGTGIQRVSGLRYFTLSSAGTTFTNGAITLSFGSDDQADNASTLRVAQRVGSAWNNLGGTVTAVPTGTITSTTAFTALTEFVLATSTADLSANPLPVELSSFTAERRGADALLRWTTAQEKNSAYFEVQRSLDGREFRALARVQAQGTSTRASSYSFLDKGAAGPVYYRLHQVDRDGTASDSRIVVLGGTMAFTATAFPNPATDLLRVSTSAPVRAWRVLSPVGPPLLRGTGQPDRVPVSSLNPGVYLLELTTGGNGRHLLRFVRQ
ncbi:hypothetical protein DLM85_20965 [Hymenobacter edaphi]|uniref:Secretion system C-terminal sorting domain-containing protein n=1 Tax=Hymenobacter edaphi TaxID=2211146 RepID=A0A328B9I7_9BACT|nr:hypothetical protein DLM85_20965 [Hymenobacter edaphi]